MGKQKKRKPSHKQRTGLMDRSDIPYAQRLKLQQKSDINTSREQAAKVTLYCLSVAMYEIKKVGYIRLVRFSHRYMRYEREFYADVELGMAHAKTRMEQMGMPISGEFFTEKVEGLTKRKQEVHDNSLQAIQVALTIGAIAMNDEFGYGKEVQFLISERVTELSDRYKREGIKFLLDIMEKIGFTIINGTVMAFTDEDGNAVSASRAKKRALSMGETKRYLVQVDVNKKWTPCTYREVDEEELDAILDFYGGTILRIVGNGNKGAMAMWACFKSRIAGGCYSDMINAYRLLTDDHKSLVDREHELRHIWNQYEELWRIRYYGTVEAYYLAKAEKAREYFDKYKPKGEMV